MTRKQAVFLNKWGRQPSSHELLPLFGVPGGHHLPDAHMTANWTSPNGSVTKLVLLTKAEAKTFSKSRRKTLRHTPTRIMAICPECHCMIPAGRLHQHMPVHYTEETRPIVWQNGDAMNYREIWEKGGFFLMEEEPRWNGTSEPLLQDEEEARYQEYLTQLDKNEDNKE